MASLIAEYALQQGNSFEHTAIATGDDFPDALVTASLLTIDKGMLLLTRAGQLPAAMFTLFNDNRGAIRLLDFVALPDLAKTMAQSTTTATGATSTSGAGATTAEAPVTSTTQ